MQITSEPLVQIHAPGFKLQIPMYSISRWPRGLGDGHWPQVWDPPKNPTTWTTRDRVPYAPNIHRLPHGKSTYRLNFLWIVVWPGGDAESSPVRAKTSLDRLGIAALVGS